MRTLLLDTVDWDLVIDAQQNIAVASEPYSLAQDAASAIKTFSQDLYYDQTAGVPYFAAILGKFPPLSYVKAKFVEAALTVPDVKSAQVFISSFKDRNFGGQVQISDREGRPMAVNF